jgi:antitoxin VapB
MSLSIKDPEAHRLAEAIAAETGQNMTRVVVDALRERYGKLEKRKKRASFEELIALATKAGEGLKRPYQDHGDMLYDEHGLPK